MGLVILCFYALFTSCLVVNTSAFNCLEKPVPKISSGTLNSTHSLTLVITLHIIYVHCVSKNYYLFSNNFVKNHSIFIIFGTWHCRKFAIQSTVCEARTLYNNTAAVSLLSDRESGARPCEGSNWVWENDEREGHDDWDFDDESEHDVCPVWNTLSCECLWLSSSSTALFSFVACCRTSSSSSLWTWSVLLSWTKTKINNFH